MCICVINFSIYRSTVFYIICLRFGLITQTVNRKRDINRVGEYRGLTIGGLGKTIFTSTRMSNLRAATYCSGIDAHKR